MDSLDGTAVLDNGLPRNPHPTPLPRQQPPPPKSPFFFGGTSPAPAEETSPPDSLDDESPSSSSEWPDESDPSPATGTGSPGSGTRVANPLNGDGLKDVLRGAVLIGGDQAHNLLARTPGQQAVDLYKTDEGDAEAIGDPLARIAGRREGIGEVSPDTADLLAAMVGITRYATKQIGRSRQARELDAAAAAPVQAVDL